MPLKRVGLELSVERDVDDADGAPPRTVRLSARFELDPAGAAVRPEEVAEALLRLSGELDGAIGLRARARSPAPRSDRSLAELVETYRPRQAELIDLLLEDGEVTEGEATRLRAYLAGTPPPPTAAPLPPAAAAPAPPEGEPPITDRPLAALPLSNDRSPAVPRPVEQLLAEYRIESLRQAGAVRARRQISYEEYMALKRHFAGPQAPSAPPSSPSG